MTKHRYMGVYMDHSKAHLIEITPDGFDTRSVESEFTHELKREETGESEPHAHNAEQHMQAAYNKKIGEALKECQEALLFGPTTAKNELLNYLKKDHHFDKIKIEVKHSDKLTENQQHAFVRDFFSIKNI
jgi:stalled ribosome rescue protein Dom34